MQRLSLENRYVRIDVKIEGSKVKEQYYSLKGREKLIAETNGGSFAACKVNMEPFQGSDTGFSYPDEPVALFNDSPDEYTDKQKLTVALPVVSAVFELYDYKLEKQGEATALTFYARSQEGDELERSVILHKDADYAEISNTLYLKRKVNLEYFTDYYTFAPGPEPDFTWTPHLKYDASCVSSDWTFKSPAAIIQKKNASLSLVPDLDFLYNDKSIMYCTTGLDLDITASPAPKAGYGFIPSEPHYHSLFIHPQGLKRGLPEGQIAFKYFLFPNGDTPEKQANRRVVSFLWEKFGSRNFLEGHNAQLKSFNVMEKEAWHWMARKFFIEFECEGQKCGGFRDYHRELEDDIWFFGWWNNLRTAYAMEAYSRRRNSPQTSAKAMAILNLIAGAPRKGGCFPAVYVVLDGKRVWTAGSPSYFGGPPYDYHTFSMSWTAYWLLKWHEDLLPEDGRLMPICVDYAEFLLKNQQPSGFIPSYYKEEDLTPDEKMEMNRENAEPAVCALFLAELYKVTKDKRYLDAAEKAVRYVEQAILPENKWYDYETFYSCSPKKYGYFDTITGQYAQCNMALIMMTHVCLELKKLTGNTEYFSLGTRVLDYLLLFQQVWSHPRMEPNLIGGFTTQNTDSEWSDSRQSYAAIILMDYYEETGDRAYLERGIAAMRATLTISPYENWSHRGYNNEPGFFSSFHWGIGTGLATEEVLWEKYGDIYVNVHGKYAYGLNGCTVTEMTAGEDAIRLKVVSGIHFVTPLRIVFRKPGARNRRVEVNGEDIGTFSPAELEKGVNWYYRNRREA